jgi:hypothetical protein
VRNVARYDIAHSDGPPRRQRYAAMGRLAPEPDIPEEAEHVWSWYWEIASTRPEHAAPICWRELQAWQAMTGELIWPHEARCLMQMDGEFRAQLAEERQAVRSQERSK